MERKELSKERDNTTLKETKIPLVLTYSRALPYISKVARKHGNILSINQEFKQILRNEQLTSFRRNKKLKELIGSNKIVHSRVK